MNTDLSYRFILQATRILSFGKHSESDLKLVYDYVISLDNQILNEYVYITTIASYQNDLILYIEIVETLMSIYEESEEYEKCFVLKKKKDEAEKIINKNKN